MAPRCAAWETTARRPARRLILALALLAVTLTAAPTAAAPLGQAATFCTAESVPAYLSGFADLKSMIGAPMGDPLTCPYLDPAGSGDFYQRTSTGVALWRKSSETYLFTDGVTHWARTPTAWLYWLGDATDPPPDATPLPTTADIVPSPTSRQLPLLPTTPPVSLTIPRLNLSDTPVVPTGLDEDGGMAAPEDPDTVGWYEYGPGVGAAGNAVLAGHVDWGGQLRVFGALSRLSPGDLVYVRAEDGSRRAYSVQWSQLFTAEAAPLEMIFGQGDSPELTLITCGGDFDHDAHAYVHRLVVRAALVTDTSVVVARGQGS